MDVFEVFSERERDELRIAVADQLQSVGQSIIDLQEIARRELSTKDRDGVLKTMAALTQRSTDLQGIVGKLDTLRAVQP